MIEAGFAWVTRNRIIDNSDGIVMFDSVANISYNTIEGNQRSGITMCGASFPKIEFN